MAILLRQRRPSKMPVTLKGGLNAVFMQDVGDGASADLMSQIGQCATDPRVSP
jgi:hypothetical protein